MHWVGKNPESITKIKPFVNRFKWERIFFPSEKDDWQKLEKNNVKIALNVLYVKNEKIYPAYVSKHNPTRGKQVIFLMISIKKKTMKLSCSKNYRHYQEE